MLIALLLGLLTALAGDLEDGDAAFQAGDYPAALVAWGDALKQARAADDVDQQRGLLLRMAAAQRELGAVDLAARVLDQADKLARDDGAKADLALDRGRLAQHRGDLEAAEQAYAKAFSRYQAAEDPRGAANAALNLAGTRLLLGQDERAIKATAAAEVLYKALGDRIGQADAALTRGLILRRGGELRPARQLVEQALQVYQAQDHVPGQITALTDLARIEAELARPVAALRHMQTARELARARKDVRRQLDLMEQEVVLRQQMGQPDAAAELLQTLWSNHRASGRRRAALEADLDLAALGRTPNDQTTWLDQAREIGDPRLEARALVQLARAGDEDARKHAQKALKLAERVDSDAIRWQALYVLGSVHQRQGDLDAAAQALSQAVDILDRRRRLLGGRAEERFVAQYDPVYRALADVHLARGETLAALATAERLSLADLPPGQAAEPAAHLAERQAWLQDQLGDEVASHGDSARATALRQELAELRIAFADTVDRLRTDVSDLDSRIRIAPEDLEALQTELPPGVVVLQPILLPDRLVLLVFSRDLLEAVPVQVSPGEIESTLARLTRALRAGLRSRSVLDPLATQLGGWLWTPVADRLEGADTVVVATAGPLRQLPFALLRHDGRYLVEQSAVATITHVGSLRGASTPLRVDGPGLLLVGNPDGSLPGAEQEVRALAGQFDGSAVLLGDEATRDALLGSLAGRTTVHLATHGRIDSSAPARSYLVLADPDGDEARLGYREIPGLSPYLGGARMVVLSACESGRPVQADQSDVVSIQGLAAQFRRAGVETLVASLWKVDDTGTRALMERFYAHLAQGHDAATALAEAQRELIDDETLGTPWVWAAFVVAGDWR